MAEEIGKIIEGQAAPPAAAANPQVDQKMMQDPRFQQILQTMMRPENMMTAIVLGAALLQPRDEGKSSLQTFAQRGLGALAFRGALGDQQEKRAMAQREENLKAKAQMDEDAYRQGMLREQAAGRIQSAQNVRDQGAWQRDIMTGRLAGEAEIARGDRASAERVAQINANAKLAPDPFQIFTKEELPQMTEAAKAMVESGQLGADGQPITMGEALKVAALRIAGPRIFMQKPEYFDLIFGQTGKGAAPTTETPAPPAPKGGTRRAVQGPSLEASIAPRGRESRTQQPENRREFDEAVVFFRNAAAKDPSALDRAATSSRLSASQMMALRKVRDEIAGERTTDIMERMKR